MTPRSILAEREGFEPSVPLTVRLISSQVAYDPNLLDI